MVKGKLAIKDKYANVLNKIVKQSKIKATTDESFSLFVKTLKEREQETNKITLEVGVIDTKITGKKIPQEKISKATQFFLLASKNTKSYKDGKWDGYIRLYNKRTRKFPTGFLERVIKILQNEKLEYEVKYLYDKFPGKEYNWTVCDDIIPDEDQIEAVESAIKYGRGIVKAPTGWGKTAVFSKNLIASLGVPAIFIANKKQLLDDAKSDFESGITGMKVLPIKDGMFGSVKMSSVYSEEELKNALDSPVIVATIQSLHARLNDENTSPILRDWLENVCKLVIVDESQAVGTTQWDEVLNSIYAPYRIFLSATPRRTDGASIKLIAGSGECIFTTTAEEQIAKGRLCELDITYEIYDHKAFNEEDKNLTYADAYKLWVTNNEERNYEGIVKPALEMVDEGRHVLILIQHIEHGHIIKQMLIQNDIDPENIRFVWGETPQKMRTSAISEFRKGDFQIMIGSTIFDAGVNIPIISGVVLGGAGNSDITLIQRIGRGARNCEFEDILGYLPDFMKDMENKVTKVHDVMDANIKFFAKQARNRYKNACAEFGKTRVFIKGTATPKVKAPKNKDLADDMAVAAAQFKMMTGFSDE